MLISPVESLDVIFEGPKYVSAHTHESMQIPYRRVVLLIEGLSQEQFKHTYSVACPRVHSSHPNCKALRLWPGALRYKEVADRIYHSFNF